RHLSRRRCTRGRCRPRDRRFPVRPSGGGLMTKLSEKPFVDPSAIVRDSRLGRYTEVRERTRFIESELGDYSYIVEDGNVWCARIGKFANIAAACRINAPNHPVQRATLH